MSEKVLLREDGPREGFQMLAQTYPTAVKLQLIRALCETGIKEIEVTSFVRAEKVPQLADAEELCAALPDRSDVRFHGLYLNEKGFKRELGCKKLSHRGYILLAASEAFLLRNNNQSIAGALAEISTWCERFRAHKLNIERLMISTSFGDALSGKISAEQVLDLCKKALEITSKEGTSVNEITFADTTGWANPQSVERLISGYSKENFAIPVGLHLHDTRGTGMANVYAALQAGVRRFDCSVGGMGGCPFSPGASGNVPTEDVAFLCHELGFETGLNLERYIECARLAEKLIGQPLPGRLKTGGLLSVQKITP